MFLVFSSNTKPKNLDTVKMCFPNNGTLRFTQNIIYTRTKLFPETKLSQQADIGFDHYTLLHCVWEGLTDIYMV